MTEIFYTINAGLYISSGRTALLIDGIHQGPSVGLSLMPEGLWEQILWGKGKFKRLDGLLFTHLHVDHYDAEMVGELLEQRPGISLWGPQLESRGIQRYREIPGGCEFEIGDFRIAAYDTTHSAECFKEVVHQSFLILNKLNGERFFIGGDAIFSPVLAGMIKRNAGGQNSVTAAFINVYHLIEEPSREFLLRLAPDRLLLYHRPYKKDDICNYLSMIRSTLRRDPMPGYTIELPEYMHWVSSEAPDHIKTTAAAI